MKILAAACVTNALILPASLGFLLVFIDCADTQLSSRAGRAVSPKCLSCNIKTASYRCCFAAAVDFVDVFTNGKLLHCCRLKPALTCFPVGTRPGHAVQF